MVYHTVTLLELMGDNEAAADTYQQLLGLVPSDASALQKLGELYDHEGDKQQAHHYHVDVRRSIRSRLFAVTIPFVVPPVLPRKSVCDRLAWLVLHRDAGGGEGADLLRESRAHAAERAEMEDDGRGLPSPHRKPAEGARALPGHPSAVPGERGMPEVPRQAVRGSGDEGGAGAHAGTEEAGKGEGREGARRQQQARLVEEEICMGIALLHLGL